MKVLNQEGASLESHMGGAIQPSEIGELGKRLKSVNDELRLLEDRWLELSSQLEASTA
jgi:ATP-binding cassette, subfamily F, member 3